jgi:hypothetical protein
MQDLIRSTILNQLSDGADVQKAYLRASNRAATALQSHLESGKEAEEALASIGVYNGREILRRFPNEKIDQNVMFIIVSGGHVDNVPEAACVAEQLRNKPNRTRKDVEDAFAYCAKQHA